ncbi:MAG: signal peptidase II [Desulfatibacillum sp.]|nr:signal peptidase II [Desulfatibacillum sp.]
MENVALKKWIRFLVVVLPVVIADQGAKMLAVGHIGFAESIEIIPGFFYLTHLYNTGGAFGLAAQAAPWIRILLFLVVSGIAAVIVLILYKKTPYESRWFSLALCLIFSGAVGNLIDRVFRDGRVVDFLEIYFPMIPMNLFNPWPPFNIADSAISVGVAVLTLYFITGKDPL